MAYSHIWENRAGSFLELLNVALSAPLGDSQMTWASHHMAGRTQEKASQERLKRGTVTHR